MKISRTVQRFTDVILDLNFKVGSSKQIKTKYRSHNKPARMSKRDRKRNINKKNRQNRNKRFIPDDFSDSDDDQYYNAKQSTAVNNDLAENWKTMLEYIIPEHIKKSEETAEAPLMFYLIDKETNIIEDYDSQEAEDKSQEGEDIGEGKDRYIHHLKIYIKSYVKMFMLCGSIILIFDYIYNVKVAFEF